MSSSLCWSTFSVIPDCVSPTPNDGLIVLGDIDSIGSPRFIGLITVFELNPGTGGGVEKLGDGWVDGKRGTEVAGEKTVELKFPFCPRLLLVK